MTLDIDMCFSCQLFVTGSDKSSTLSLFTMTNSDYFVTANGVTNLSWQKLIFSQVQKYSWELLASLYSPKKQLGWSYILKLDLNFDQLLDLFIHRLIRKIRQSLGTIMWSWQSNNWPWHKVCGSPMTRWMKIAKIDDN